LSPAIFPTEQDSGISVSHKRAGNIRFFSYIQR